jgi:glutamine amidotransferase
MQMLLERSEEYGVHKGLGLIPGNVRRFPRRIGQKVPHMGWNTLALTSDDNPLFEGFGREESVYFVHSYYAETGPEFTLTRTEYICPFASSVGNGTT